MAYNAQAMQYANPESDRWLTLYDDIAWATCDRPVFTTTELVGQCESIARMAPKTQVEIIRAHLKSHELVPEPGDHIVRLTTKFMAWQLHDEWDKPKALPPRP